MTTVACALLLVLGSLSPTPASAWVVTSPQYKSMRIERGVGDTTGTAYIYYGSVTLSNLREGTWDETATAAWVYNFEVKFDEDDLAYNTVVSPSNFLVICPGGDTFLGTGGGGPLPVYMTNSLQQRVDTLPVSLSTSPPLSVMGTVAVSEYPTPPADAATVSVAGTIPVTVAGTVPVDAFGGPGLPGSWGGSLAMVVALAAGFVTLRGGIM